MERSTKDAGQHVEKSTQVETEVVSLVGKYSGLNLWFDNLCD